MGAMFACPVFSFTIPWLSLFNYEYPSLISSAHDGYRSFLLSSYTCSGNAFNFNYNSAISEISSIATITLLTSKRNSYDYKDVHNFLHNSNTVLYSPPSNSGLLQAKDSDGPGVKYSITGNAADQFTVDEDTGEVFVVKGSNCNPDCKFSVRASDTVSSDEMNVTVSGLYTLLTFLKSTLFRFFLFSYMAAVIF